MKSPNTLRRPHHQSPSPSDSSKGSTSVGILTGGGDCPGLNAVIRAVCTTLHKSNIRLLGFVDGFEGIYRKDYVDLDCSVVENMHVVGGTMLGTTNKGHYQIPISEETFEITLKNYHQLGLSCIICVGGDGTMGIASLLAERGMNIVGVPKTIDNDLGDTDQTFGFDSAVSVVTDALDRLHTTAMSHHRAMIVEVMGRNAGWIALHSGLSGGAHVIILPEADWQWEPILRRIKERALSKDCLNHSIVVVSEGASLPGKGQIAQEEYEGRVKDCKRLGGIGKFIANHIQTHAKVECRVTVLGHVQRGGSPTSFDRILATKYGCMAAKLAAAGDYNKMVSLKATKVVAVPIHAGLGKQRLVDMENDQVVWAARMTGVVFGDEDETSSKGETELKVPSK